MMKIYLTADKQLTHADAIEDGSWVCLTQPTPEEIRQVAGTLDIEPADLQAALDPEESARRIAGGRLYRHHRGHSRAGARQGRGRISPRSRWVSC